MTTINVKRVKTTDELKREIEDKQVEGWQLNSQSDNVAIMKKRGKLVNPFIHLAIIAFTFWTFGACNVLYAGITYLYTRSEFHIKVE